MFEFDWLMAQYPERFRNLPLLIVHGEQGASNTQLQSEASRYPNIKLFQVSCRIFRYLVSFQQLPFVYCQLLLLRECISQNPIP